MTAAEWLSSEDPAAMLRWVDGSQVEQATPWTGLGNKAIKVSDRKLRLFACACCRLFKPQNTAEQLDEMERSGEPFGMADAQWAKAWACDTAHAAAKAALLREVVGDPFADLSLMVRDGHLYRRLSRDEKLTRNRPCVEERWERPDWLTPQVLSLAQAAYDERPGRECGECAGGLDLRALDTNMGAAAIGDLLGILINPKSPKTSEMLERASCKACGGTGTIDDGTLDPVRLLVLRDALMDAGCDCELLLSHLAEAGPHVRGCWALYLILGKE